MVCTFVLVLDLAGFLRLEVTPVPDTVMPCLSPELIPIKPVSEKNLRPLKELLEFPSNDVYVPHCIYRSIYTFDCESFGVRTASLSDITDHTYGSGILKTVTVM